MTIIPAPAGFRLVRTFRGDTPDKIAGYLGEDSEMVIAFLVDPTGPISGHTAPLPITPSGAPNTDRPWVLVHPDGNFSMGGDRYSSFADWKADVRWDA